MLGRTNVSLPVCSSSRAPPCREFEPCIELIMQRSSTLAGEMREQLADGDAALAVSLKLERRAQQVAGLAGDHAGLGEREGLAVVAIEERLVDRRCRPATGRRA